jgi:ABC-type multidrug transport system permease subunit
MKRIADIGHTDLKLFLRWKSLYLWIFLMPLAFVYFMGFANHGPDAPGNRRPNLFVDNADTNFLGRIFCDELGAQGLRLVKTNEDAAGEIHIPADLTERMLAGKQTKLRLRKHDASGEGDAAIIELRLVRAIVALNGHMLEAAFQTNAPADLSEVQLREVLAKPNPVTLDASFAGRKPVPAGFNFSLPAILVMYLMMNLLIFGGATVAAERRNGVLRRLMSTPTSRTEIVQGKIYGLMLLGIVQTAFLLAVGKFLFHVSLGANLPGVAVVLIVFGWVAGSLGVLIGSVTVAEERVVGICVLASLLMAALGGCWWPLEIAPPVQKFLALCLPTGWVLQALHQLISFGSAFEAALIPLAALLGFGLAANLLAARFFKG